MADTVGQLLVQRLIDWGVDTIFGLPGDGVNGIFEALRVNQKKIRFIQVRHEESAAFAACGYAKYTRRLGVCLATSGPGGIHLLNGLYDAKFDGQPVLAITGHTFHDLIGTHYQQDVDLDKLFIDVAEYNQRVMGPAHVGNVVDEAIKTALARRGVAHINIPKDIQDWDANGHRSSANISKHSADRHASSLPLPASDLLQEAAAVINRGRKIVILAGAGCLQARPEVSNLAERTAGVIIKPLLGKAVVADDHPHTTGGIGLLGTAPSADAMKNCDTLIIAGSSFPYIEFYPEPGAAKVVQIDIDPTRIGLRAPVDVGLAGDCAAVLRALLPLLKRNRKKRFLRQAQSDMNSWRELMKAEGTRKDLPLKPQVVMYELNRYLSNDAIVSADSGTISTWAARYVDIKGDMQFSLSGTLASMANGLPYSIAAAVAYPERQVVCIIGDGGFTMLMGELATLAKYKLPVKIIIVKNNVLGMIKWEQMVLEGNPQYGVELQPIDFAAYARACGIAGYTIAKPEETAPILRDAFANQGPAVIEAVVDPYEPPMPGSVTVKQSINFMKALVRGQKDRWKILETVIEDKVREVI
jgi:pyruvate dehydrogenase (quinone)